MNTLGRKAKQLTIISIILIIVASYGIFFYLQNTTEDNIRTRFFDDQKQHQIDSTRAMSLHISSDLNLVLANLRGLANSAYIIQQGGGLLSITNNNSTRNLIEGVYLQINSIVDRLFLVDKNNIIILNMVSKGQKTFVGSNISHFDWVTETKTEKRPIFSDGYLGLDGKYRIGITYPIINTETGEYLGLVGAAVPAVQFFSNYGNIYDIELKFLVAYDKSTNYIATPRTQFLGENFFGIDVQEFFHYNQIQNNLYHKVFSGESGYAIYDFGSGERLNTGYPIFLSGKPTYFVFVITPTAAIYSLVDRVLFTQRIETFSLLAGITIAVVVLIIFLIKWNSSLDYEVKRRTNELNQANEQLKVHDKMQKEFIDVAAHELRTPTQAIVGYSELLDMEPERSKEYVGPILRNAERLQRLTGDILDVARMESRTLKLNIEQFNLKDVISSNIQDYRNQIENQGKKEDIKLVYHDDDDNEPKDIFIKADKARVSQVISNLLNNAIKFTKEGVISITAAEKKGDDDNDNDDEVILLQVKDTGQGIDSGIFPRLFSKFVSKSFEGTGLGLYISKSIVEAHGGKIWAENNADGKGATFAFTLPLSNSIS